MNLQQKGGSQFILSASTVKSSPKYIVNIRISAGKDYSLFLFSYIAIAQRNKQLKTLKSKFQVISILHANKEEAEKESDKNGNKGFPQRDGESAAYVDKEVVHVFQWLVEGSQDFGLLERDVKSFNQLFVALEHGRRVTPADLLQMVKTP